MKNLEIVLIYTHLKRILIIKADMDRLSNMKYLINGK